MSSNRHQRTLALAAVLAGAGLSGCSTVSGALGSNKLAPD